MKTKKIRLDSFKVKSFVTSIKEESSNDILGGVSRIIVCTVKETDAGVGCPDEPPAG